MKLLKKTYKSLLNTYIKRRRRKMMISALETECFKLRYSLINLCMSYANDGLKRTRFIHRVEKNARILKRRELHLIKLKNM